MFQVSVDRRLAFIVNKDVEFFQSFFHRKRFPLKLLLLLFATSCCKSMERNEGKKISIINCFWIILGRVKSLNLRQDLKLSKARDNNMSKQM